MRFVGEGDDEEEGAESNEDALATRIESTKESVQDTEKLLTETTEQLDAARTNQQELLMTFFQVC